MSRATAIACALFAVGLVAVVAPALPARTQASVPLIGANYTHHRNASCSVDDAGIIRSYHEPAVRRRVRAQLAAMRSAGIETLRLLLWHMTNAGFHRWGVVSSSGGRISEPNRSNLIRYLRDVRAAGYARLTVSFGPMWTNSPFGQPDYVYEPAQLEENWAFIRDVRTLLATHGPPFRVDLINEAAPSDYTPAVQQPGLRHYIAEMYSRYVRAYGNDDVLVSAIAKGDPSRLANLVQILRGTGLPLPRWFEIHPSYSAAEALRDLRAADATLAANGLTQPFVIGESAYDDAPVAQAIAEFIGSSTRAVEEVVEWPLHHGSSCRDFSAAPPYRADGYVTALTGRPAAPPTPSPLALASVPTLRASVGPGNAIALRTAAGATVTTLDAGEYRIIVADRSQRDNFHLVGADVDRRTGLRPRGTVEWRVQLGLSSPYGSRVTYRSDRPGAGLRRSFSVR